MPEKERLAPTLPALTSAWTTARHSDSGWPLFLESVWLGAFDGGQGIRGWTGDLIEFRFPVVAIAGENGSGKSTVLKAAAAAYGLTSSAPTGAQSFSPDDFFPSTPWETVDGVKLEYKIRQGTSSRTYSLRKRTVRWRGMPERPTRNVYFLDISRTQPIDTLIGYGRLARTKLAGSAGSLLLQESFRSILSRVLSRTYETGELVRYGQGKQIGVVTSGGKTYSNYHQGAGEDATTDLMALLQEAPRNSLVLIDEVEASLHPRAQRRLMTELIGLASTKKLQIIVSTHSPYVLEQLPAEARIYLQVDRKGAKEVIYGITPEYALTLMDDQQRPELIVYCEDTKAADVIDSILRASDTSLLQRIRVVPVWPASTVRVFGTLITENRLPDRAVGVLDGDQDEAPGCIRIPGGSAPERAVFEDLDEATWTIVAERLGAHPGSLLDAVEDAMRVDEHHTWVARTAERLHGRTRPSAVWEAAVDVWVRDVLPNSDKTDFAASIAGMLTSVVAGSDGEPS